MDGHKYTQGIKAWSVTVSQWSLLSVNLESEIFLFNFCLHCMACIYMLNLFINKIIMVWNE